MKELKLDSSEYSNTLLRILIRNVHRPEAFNVQDIQQPPIFTPTQQAVRINAFYFSRFCCSLLTSLGAVLAKQWLKYYEETGSLASSLPKRCRERQMKFLGVKRWRLEAIIETLPIILQLSLFLFLMGLCEWALDANALVFFVVSSFSGVTIFYHIVTIIISILDPGSPLQTRLSKSLRAVLVSLLTITPRYLIRVYYGVRRQGFHILWSWPMVLLSALFSSDLHMKTARPTKLFTDVLFYRGLGFLRNFLRTLIFTRHHQSNTWVFHRAGDVIAALLIAIIALIVNGINYWLDEEEEDRYGASCVFWLAEQQFNHSEISKRVIEAASKLGEGAFKKPGVLRLLILGILRPRRKGFNQTPSLVLDISTDELRILLAPLGRFLSLNVGRDTVILEDESGADCDHQLWALLCDALWYAVRTTPDDEQLLQSVSVILNTGRVLQWTMKPSKFSDLAVFGQHISRGLQALPQVELGNIFPTALTRLQHDQLTIFTFLFAAHLDYHIQLENISIPASEIPEPILLYAIVTCFEEASQGRGDIWSGRLRLLLLQHIPKMIIPLLEAQATCFVETLWNAQRMDELFWRNENPEPILKQRRDSLHLRTVRLLLVANHDFWYERLNRSGHIKYIWDLLGYGLPGRQIERRVELDILDDWFETERAQEVWGNMLIPLENFMAIWACVYADDRDRTRRLYHTRVWADVVENAIMRLGKVRSISINQFCYNITPQEMMQMMDSITRYIALVDARRTGFSGMMARTQLRLAFISFASHLMAYYNPLLLRFTSSTRCRMAWDSWRRDNYQERWRDRIRGSMSKFLQVARV